jgi:4-oxalocrotonate tautomerase
MPFIRVTILGPTLAAGQPKQLQQGTTDLMVAVMRKPVEGVAVLVEQVTPSAWSIPGRPTSVTAHVEATIAQGTNTPDEKAKFIAEMWTLLRSALGPELWEETYIVCHEIAIPKRTGAVG